MERVLISLWLVVLIVPGPDLHGNPVRSQYLERSDNNFTRFEENGKVGLKDDQGHVLIPPLYDALGWADGRLTIIDGVIGYQLNGLWGIISTANNIIAAAGYLDLRPGEGSYLIGQKKSALSQRPSFGIINTSGKIAIPFAYDGLKLINMRAVVMSRTGTRFLFGLTDLSHKVLIPVEYQRVYSLGSLRFAVENFAGKTAIFSDDGTQITDFTIDSISAFKKGHAIVYQEQREGLINRDGRFVLEPRPGHIRINDDGGIEVKELDAWYFLDGENNLIKRCQADRVLSLSPTRYAITRGGKKFRVTDNDFRELHTDYFSSVTPFSDGLALFRKGGKSGVMNVEGDIIIAPVYDDLVIDGHVFLAASDRGSKNRWVILDQSGNPITEKSYEEIAPYNGKFYAVKRRGFWGAVDAAGKEIISCVHDSITQRLNDHVVVRFKGKYGVVDIAENWVVTPQDNRIALLNDSVYFTFGDSTTFLKAFPARTIYFSENPLEYVDGAIREQLTSGAYWIIDMKGTVVYRSSQPEMALEIFEESEGYRAIYKDGKYGFIDSAGRLRIANRYQRVKPFNDQRAAIQIRGKWGFIDLHENLIVQPIYDHVDNFANGMAIVRQDGHYGLVDRAGRIVLPVRYDDITLNEHKRFILRQGSSLGLADAGGTMVIHPKYDDLSDNGTGYVIVSRGGKSGVLTLHGVSTIPMIYDELAWDSDHQNFIGVRRASWENFTPQP